MWVFTETGFVSAVMHFSDNNVIVVRARESESLDGIAALADAPITEVDLHLLTPAGSRTYSRWRDQWHTSGVLA